MKQRKAFNSIVTGLAVLALIGLAVPSSVNADGRDTAFLTGTSVSGKSSGRNHPGWKNSDYVWNGQWVMVPKNHWEGVIVDNMAVAPGFHAVTGTGKPTSVNEWIDHTRAPRIHVQDTANVRELVYPESTQEKDAKINLCKKAEFTFIRVVRARGPNAKGFFGTVSNPGWKMPPPSEAVEAGGVGAWDDDVKNKNVKRKEKRWAERAEREKARENIEEANRKLADIEDPALKKYVADLMKSFDAAEEAAREQKGEFDENGIFKQRFDNIQIEIQPMLNVLDSFPDSEELKKHQDDLRKLFYGVSKYVEHHSKMYMSNDLETPTQVVQKFNATFGNNPNVWFFCSLERRTPKRQIPPAPATGKAAVFKRIDFEGHQHIYPGGDENGGIVIGDNNLKKDTTGWKPTAFKEKPYNEAAKLNTCGTQEDFITADPRYKNNTGWLTGSGSFEEQAEQEEPGRRYTLTTKPHNLKAISEGGVFDWSVHEREGSWTGWLYCAEWHYEDRCAGSGKNRHCWKVKVCDAWGCRSKPSLDPPHLTHFWQQFSVQCNQKGYNQVISRTRGDLETKWPPNPSHDGEGGRFFGQAYTKTYHKVNYVFGDKHQEAKESPGFFTKECPFHCTTDSGVNPQPSEAGGNVESKYIDALGKRQDGGAYGNRNKSENTKEIQQFRDGQSIPLYINMSWPVNGDAVNYDGSSAKTTTIIRDPAGTPDTNPLEGGLFRLMLSPGGENLFGASGNRTEKQEGYVSATPQKNAMIAVIPGGHNQFYISHTWASHVEHPNRLNFKWEYDAQVKNNPIGSVTLRGQNVKEPNYRQWEAERVDVSIANVSVTHDGKCYGSFGNPNGYETTELFQANTGRGVENKMDNNFINNFTSWLAIRGVRSVTK